MKIVQKINPDTVEFDKKIFEITVEDEEDLNEIRQGRFNLKETENGDLTAYMILDKIVGAYTIR